MDAKITSPCTWWSVRTVSWNLFFSYIGTICFKTKDIPVVFNSNMLKKMFTPKLPWGFMIQFDEHNMFQMGWLQPPTIEGRFASPGGQLHRISPRQRGNRTNKPAHLFCWESFLGNVGGEIWLHYVLDDFGCYVVLLMLFFLCCCCCCCGCCCCCCCCCCWIS